MPHTSQPPLSYITIRPVNSRKERRIFLTFPWRIYKDDPMWVPPVLSERKARIDPTRNGLFQTGEVALHSTGRTKFKGGGPGLGLAIAKGIIEAHGGRIWAESERHDEEHCPGSTFHVLLPVKSRVRVGEISSPFSYARS